ncbi:hypothetical protein GF325_06315 [Candidatus Bathyarchaeota archaeon]|nr:hypothetical protein [Candidatus Bathyarchaeota archaeon]
MTFQDISGKIVPRTKRGFLIYFCVLIALFFGFITTAWIIFPGTYSIIDSSLSTLGVMGDNPDGWYFFTLAIWSVAIGIIPLYFTIHDKLGREKPILGKVTLFFETITSIGLFMVGTFQEGGDLRRVHLYSAYVGFGGFFVSAIFGWILLGFKISTLNGPEKRAIAKLFSIQIAVLSFFAALFITNIVLNGMGVIGYKGDPIGWFIGFPFTEWMLVFAIFIDKAILVLNISKVY